MKYNETHAKKCEKLNKKYLFSYERGDILIDSGRVVMKSCSYLRIICLYCKKEYDITSTSLHRENLCGYCCNTIEDSFYYKFPNLELYDENLNKVDSKLLYSNSNKRFLIKCEKCGNISSKTYQLSNINQREYYSCKFCSDGVSYPNKFMGNLLKMLNVDYKTEVTRKTLEWCENYRYDFYILSLNLIIEMDGNFGHGRETPYIDKETSIKIDNEKDRLAKENGLKIIRIDCRYPSMSNRFKYIKTEIEKELGEILNFENVNWELINELSLESNMIKSWEMWNKNMSISNISKELNISEDCIRRYLNEGNKIKKCAYDGGQEIAKSNRKRVHGKEVKMIFPNGEIKIFNSIDSFLKFLNIGYTAFHNNLLGYNDINIDRIKSNSRTAKIVKEKLEQFNGCKYIIKNWE